MIRYNSGFAKHYVHILSHGGPEFVPKLYIVKTIIRASFLILASGCNLVTIRCQQLLAQDLQCGDS